MKKNILALIGIALLSSCIKPDEQGILKPELFGDWIPVKEDPSLGWNGTKKSHPPLIGFTKLGFSFDSTGTVDTKRGYFKMVDGLTRRGRKFYLLDTKTKYYVKGDTLKIFDLSDSSWWSQRIVKVTQDTLSLSSSPGMVQKYVKKDYDLEAKPTFDKIIVSTSGCYGSCPISNTIINADGQVIFFGERYTTKTGFFEGTISKSLYQQLENNFRKANIDSLPTKFSTGATDLEELTVTFIKDDTIYKTISDYGKAGPIELDWAFLPIRFLYQKINLNPLPKLNHPYYPALFSLKFEKGNKELVLPRSESFLLWDYLRRGKMTSKPIEKRFSLSFQQNFYWFPSGEEERRGIGYDKGPVKVVKEIVTDGQYFIFLIEGKDPVTIDIGFNFFDRNYSLRDFRDK